MHTTITVVDGADGLTPDMLRVRPPVSAIDHIAKYLNPMFKPARIG